MVFVVNICKVVTLKLLVDNNENSLIEEKGISSVDITNFESETR